MTALTLNHEFGLMRVRFRRMLAISIVLHGTLVAALVLNRHFAPQAERLVEITWLDPEVLVPAPKPVPIEPVRSPSQPELSVQEKLARKGEGAARVQAKLAALQPAAVVEKAVAVLPTASANLLDTAQATMAPRKQRDPPTHLNRGPGVQQSAVALTRGPATSHRAAAVVAELPDPRAGTAINRSAADATAVRHLGGATLAGLVADRRVITHVMPAYPEWATTQAVEATVTLYLRVAPDGRVRPNVMIEKTAGYEDFDRNAVAAIRQWRFEPLAGHDAREQWGTITFRYRLHD